MKETPEKRIEGGQSQRGREEGRERGSSRRTSSTDNERVGIFGVLNLKGMMVGPVKCTDGPCGGDFQGWTVGCEGGLWSPIGMGMLLDVRCANEMIPSGRDFFLIFLDV